MLSRRLTAPLQAAMPWVSMLSLTSSGTQNSGGSVPFLASACAELAVNDQHLHPEFCHLAGTLQDDACDDQAQALLPPGVQLLLRNSHIEDVPACCMTGPAPD